MQPIKVFISHASGESELGNLIKTHIDAAFIGLIDVYVSSDGTSIAVGDNWMNSVLSHLQEADIFIILCSQFSLDRPWINLELGAGLTRGKTIIPLCHTDLLAAQLVRRPLSDFEALNASDPQGLKSLFTKLANALGSRVPTIDWARLAREVQVFESRYLAQKRTISQAKLQNRSPEIAELSLPAPDVLCVSSMQFQTTVREDLEMIRAAFPNQAHHEVITTSKELADLLVRKHFDVIHVAAFVCPATGDLVFSAVDPVTKHDLEKPRDELSAEQFMALVARIRRQPRSPCQQRNVGACDETLAGDECGLRARAGGFEGTCGVDWQLLRFSRRGLHAPRLVSEGVRAASAPDDAIPTPADDHQR